MLQRSASRRSFATPTMLILCMALFAAISQAVSVVSSSAAVECLSSRLTVSPSGTLPVTSSYHNSTLDVPAMLRYAVQDVTSRSSLAFRFKSTGPGPVTLLTSPHNTTTVLTVVTSAESSPLDVSLTPADVRLDAATLCGDQVVAAYNVTISNATSAAALITLDAHAFFAGLCVKPSALVAVTGSRMSGVVWLPLSSGVSALVGPLHSRIRIEPTGGMSASSCEIGLEDDPNGTCRTWAAGHSQLAQRKYIRMDEETRTSRALLTAADSFIQHPNASSDGIMCVVSGTQLFDASLVPIGSELLDVVQGFCYFFGTVAEIHNACQDDRMCIGYTTNVIPGVSGNCTETEVPLCLLFSGAAGADPWAKLERVLYRKPVRRECLFKNVTIASPLPSVAAVSLWLSQASMRSSVADVYVNGSFAVRCGGLDDPFHGGVFGQDGACRRMVLCTTLHALPGSTHATDFAVVFRSSNATTDSSSSYGCVDTYTAVLTASTEPTDTSSMQALSPRHESIPEVRQGTFPHPSFPAPLIAQALHLSDAEALDLETASQWVPLSDTSVSVFALNAEFALLEVQQAADSSSTIISVSSEGGAQRRQCGGLAPSQFVSWDNAAVPPLARRCDVLHICGGPLALNLTAVPGGNVSTAWAAYTGSIRIGASATEFVDEAVKSCGMLLVRLTIARRRSLHTSSAFGFPLGSSTGLFQPLLSVATIGNFNVTDEALRTMFEWDRLIADGRNTFNFVSSAVFAAAPGRAWATVPVDHIEDRLTYLKPNVTLGVFMDQLQSGGASFFFLPQSANFLTVRVSQSLLSAGSSVSILLWMGYTILDTVTCYQSEDYVQQSDSCDTFLACRSMVLEPGRYESVTVTANGRYNTDPKCPLALGVTLAFTERLMSALAPTAPLGTDACAVVCPSSGACLSRASLCNGLVDCSGAFDETWCSQWFAVEDGRTMLSDTGLDAWMLPSTSPLVKAESRTVAGCKIEAIIARANAFAFNSTRCVVFNVSERSVNDPAASLVPHAGVRIFVFLPVGDASTYGGCSSVYSCNGHGVAHGTSASSCTCVCDSYFSGTTCDTEISASENLYLIQVAWNTTGAPSSTAATYAIAKATRHATVACRTLGLRHTNENSSAVGLMLCTVEPNAAQQSWRVLPAAFADQSIDQELRHVHPGASALDVARATLVRWSAKRDCIANSPNETGSVTFTCENTNASLPRADGSLSFVRLVLTADGPATTVTVAADSLVLACAWVSEAGDRGGCVSHVCLLPVTSAMRTSSRVTVTAAFSQARPAAAQICMLAHPFHFDVITALAVPPVADAGSFEATVSSIRLPLLIVGGTLCGVGGILGFVGIAMLCVDRSQRMKIEAAASVEPTIVTRVLREIFSRLQLYVRTPNRFRFEKWSVVHLVASYNVVVLGVVGLLIAVLYPPTTDYLVSVESYSSRQCDAGLLSSSPSSVIVIDPTKPCETLLTAGTAGFGGRSVQATCVREDSDDSVWVELAYGDSAHECRGSDAITLRVRNGSCVAAPSFFRDPFLFVVCGSPTSVLTRYAAFQATALSAVAVSPNSVSVQQLPSMLAQPTISDLAAAVDAADVVGAKIYRRPFVKGRETRVSTSFSPETSTATAAVAFAFSDEDSGASRVVYQTDASFAPTASEASAHANLDAALRVALASSVSTLDVAAVAAFSPSRTRDAPIGFLFNAFNRTDVRVDSKRWLDRSQRYYDVRKSPFDVGYFYGPESDADGLGFTISMWARLATSAEGFLFVATDAVEERHPSLLAPDQFVSSPLVDSLRRIESQLLDGDEWFDADFHVYSALYVSSVTKRIHFVMADPRKQKTSLFDVSGNATRYTRAVWDLDKLGYGSALFNQEWHHIAVRMENVNSQTKARLLLDGNVRDTSDWNKCLLRRPTGVVDWTDASVSTVAATSPLLTTAHPGGVLYVGVVQGGVAGLRFEPLAVNDLTVITRGTPAMQRLHNLHRDQIEVIGTVLIALATVMLVFTICGSSHAVSADHEKLSSDDIEDCVRRYVRITKFAVTNEAGERYPRVGFSVARRWLDFNQAQLTLFLDELQQAAKYPHRELVRILYLVRVAARDQRPFNVNQPVPTLAEWLELLELDRRHPKLAKPQNIIERFVAAAATTIQLSAGDDEEALHPLEKALHSQAGDSAPSEYDVVQAKKRRAVCKSGNALLRQQSSADANDDGEDLGQEAAEGDLRTAGANYVDVGGGLGKSRDGLGGTGGDRSTGGSGTGDSSNAITAQLYNFFLPLISSLQVAYVWMTSLSLPGDYDNTFGNFFSAVAVDVAQMVQKIAAYATPLMQLLAGLIIIAGLYYLSTVDNRMFEWYAARYAYRRDMLEGRKPAASVSGKARVVSGHALPQASSKAASIATRAASAAHQLGVYAYSLVESQFLRDLRDPFDDTVTPGVRFEIELLPLTQCQKIDRFVGAFSSLRRDALRDAKELKVVDDEGTGIVLTRQPTERSVPGFAINAEDESKKDTDHVDDKLVELAAAGRARIAPCRRPHPADKLFLECESAMCEPRLEVLGCFCRRHPTRRLSPLVQTGVWPFEDPPTCCVVVNGQPCGQRSGVIFSCGAHGSNRVTGGTYACDYAICERHYRGGLKDVLLAKGVGIIRLVRDRGWAWALSVIFVTAANSTYTPFMKTALMILSCHPFFQCTFACWDAPDVVFVVAVFLSLVMLALFGLGIPLVQVLLLRFRKRRLEALLLAPEYGGRYSDREEPPPQLADMELSEFIFGIFTGHSIPPLLRYMKTRASEAQELLEGSVEGHDEADPRGQRPPTSPKHPTNSQSDTEGGTATSDELPRPTVSTAEWARFLATDPSALAVLYNTMELRWMHLSPVLLMFKVIVISQVVFLPTGSIQQRTGMAVVEVLFAALVFFTAPFTSPVVDAMYRLASIHQLYLLGLQNLDTVRTIDGRGSLGLVMLGCSAIYIGVCACVTAVTTVWPAVKLVRDKQQSQALLQALGIQYSGTTNLYLTPVVGRGVRVHLTDEMVESLQALGAVVEPAAEAPPEQPVEGESPRRDVPAPNPLAPSESGD